MFKNVSAKDKNKIIIIFSALVFLDFLVFYQVFAFSSADEDLKLYFLSVGQGDSELVVLPGGVKVLIDGGQPNGRVLEELNKILPPADRYLDLVIMSHPQLDHFGGLIEVLKRYRVGAFLWSGREGEITAFSDLKNVLTDNSVRTVVLSAGDKINYRESRFDILSPSPSLLGSKELNDTSIVAELSSNNSRVLFTGDIGASIEEALASGGTGDIDILKVAHHGSKFSSSANFLTAVRPELAVIGVGKNSYGHPTNQALGRLGEAGAKIYRTDKDGTVELIIDGEKIRIFKEGKVE